MWTPTVTDEAIRAARTRARDLDAATRARLVAAAGGTLRELRDDHIARGTREFWINAPESIWRVHRLNAAIDMLEVAAAQPDPPGTDLIKAAHENTAEGVALTASLVGDADEDGYVHVTRGELLSLHARLAAAETALVAARATIALLEQP